MNQGPDNLDIIKSLADLLDEAETSRHPIQPLTDLHPDLTLNDAYRIQQFNMDRRIRSGDQLIGHKIGLTAKPMQEKFGVSEPDYGHLLGSMQLTGQEPLDLDQLVDPQVEVEPAFVLASELRGPGLTIDDVINATDYVTTCFEIIDSRIIDWRIKLPDTVADNGSSARFVLGRQRVDPKDVNLADLETQLEIDGQIVDTGNTSAVLGHPANGIVWLGNKIAEFGLALEAGHMVLPGTCIKCFRIAGHKQARGAIEGLGDVTVELVGTPSVMHDNS